MHAHEFSTTWLRADDGMCLVGFVWKLLPESVTVHMLPRVCVCVCVCVTRVYCVQRECDVFGVRYRVGCADMFYLQAQIGWHAMCGATRMTCVYSPGMCGFFFLNITSMVTDDRASILTGGCLRISMHHAHAHIPFAVRASAATVV
jgi:hypothetical protein